MDKQQTAPPAIHQSCSVIVSDFRLSSGFPPLSQAAEWCVEDDVGTWMLCRGFSVPCGHMYHIAVVNKHYIQQQNSRAQLSPLSQSEECSPEYAGSWMQEPLWALMPSLKRVWYQQCTTNKCNNTLGMLSYQPGLRPMYLVFEPLSLNQSGMLRVIRAGIRCLMIT